MTHNGVMENAEILEITREAIMMIIVISTPIMIIGLVLGLIIALFQALTQIQEMTLAFVPKIIGIFLALYLLMPFMVNQLAEFTTDLADLIITIQ